MKIAKNIFLQAAESLWRHKLRADQQFYDIAHKMVLQDIIMHGLANAGLLQDVAFQGGTCLQRVHGVPRMSEDLDFTCPMMNDSGFIKFSTEFRKMILAKITSLDIPRNQVELQEPSPVEDGKLAVLRWKMKIALQRGKSVVHIEVAGVPSHDAHMETYVPISELVDVPPILLLAESKEEILANKIVALCDRPHLKARDVFDVFIMKNMDPDFDMAIRKFGDYGTPLESVLQAIPNKIEQISAPEFEEFFIEEMKRFVHPDMIENMKRMSGAAAAGKAAVALLEKTRTIIEDYRQSLTSANLPRP